MVDVEHDQRHPPLEAAGTLQLLDNAHLEITAVVDSGKPVHVGKLLHAVEVVGFWMAAAQISATYSSGWMSSGSKAFFCALSSASTPSFSPKMISGTHISDWVSAKPAIYPSTP